MAATLQDVLDFIRNPALDLDDRQALVDALNQQQRARRSQARQGLYEGKRVTWYSTRQGRQVTGVIKKVNRVNCDVYDDVQKVTWRVPPQLLTAAT